MTPLTFTEALWAHGAKLGALLAVLAILVYFIHVTAPKRWRD